MPSMSVPIVSEPSGSGIPNPADLLESPDGMRRWLAQQQPTQVVGFPESLTGCPLAEYLTAQGVSGPAVGPHSLRWDWADGMTDVESRECPRFLLPPWAADLVNAVDRLSPYRGITAAHATTLLHQVSRAGREL